MLGYCAFVLRRHLGFSEAGERRPRDNSFPEHANLPAVAPDGLIGRMEVARLGVSVVVVEGTSNKTLRRAVGHIAGTALPDRPATSVSQGIATRSSGRCETSRQTTS